MENLHTLTVMELNELKKQVIQMIDLKGGLDSILNEGDTCYVDHNKTRGFIGTILKINKTKCKIDFGAKGIMNVPKNMIDLI
jgi:preprotein translocase subunit YajC